MLYISSKNEMNVWIQTYSAIYGVINSLKLFNKKNT